MTATFDDLMARIEAGTPLAAADLTALVAAPDLLPLGMLADAMRRRVRGTTVTFARVARCGFDQSFAEAVSPVAREVRITGAPGTLDIAATAVASARAVAGDRTVAGFTWIDVDRWVEAGTPADQVLARLRGAGLDAIELPLDRLGDAAAVIERMMAAGFRQLRLTIDKALASDRTPLLLRAAALQERFGSIQVLNPLPMTLNAMRPTTGYEDVKSVALARLAAPNIPSIQVDWLRYGPKLAQVALTFGADDLDEVSPSDESPDGRRRAPLEEIRRNVEAAGFTAAERDGRFAAA